MRGDDRSSIAVTSKTDPLKRPSPSGVGHSYCETPVGKTMSAHKAEEQGPMTGRATIALFITPPARRNDQNHAHAQRKGANARPGGTANQIQGLGSGKLPVTGAQPFSCRSGSREHKFDVRVRTRKGGAAAA